MRRGAVLLGFFGALACSGQTFAAAGRPGKSDPDWPCQQIKVDELSVAAFWNGPAIDLVAHNWRQNANVSALVDLVIQRRLPIDEAQQKIVAFAQGLRADKQATLTALFIGVFDVLNGERTNVMAGLDRFGQRQKDLASSLRQEGEVLRAAQVSDSPDSARVTELTKQLLWDTQVFETRRTSLRFACDVPSIIEQRLYGLAQTIQQQLN